MSPVSDLAAEAFLGWSSVVLPPQAAAAASLGLAGVPRPPSHSPRLLRAQGALSTSLQLQLLERAGKAQLTAQRFPACSGLILPVPPVRLWRVGAGRPRVSLSSSWALSLPTWAVRLSISKAKFPRQICSPYDLLVPAWKILTEQVWGGGNRNLFWGLFCLFNFSF